MGMGDAAKASESTTWGPGAYQQLGAQVAGVAKAARAASAAVSFVAPPAEASTSDAVQQLAYGESSAAGIINGSGCC